jgi:hypothetical protein
MVNFYSASKRHFNDGNLLAQNNRLINATHLWAYGAECLLKAILEKQGHLTLKNSGRPRAPYALHINQQAGNPTTNLLSLYNALQTGTNALIAPNQAFSGWTIDQRYEDDPEIVNLHTIFAQDAQIFQMLHMQAIKNGVLP